MKFLLDTNACIGVLRGRSLRLAERLGAVAQEDIALCSVVVGELLFGARKSARTEQNLAAVRLFASKSYSLPFVFSRYIKPGMKRLGCLPDETTS